MSKSIPRQFFFLLLIITLSLLIAASIFYYQSYAFYKTAIKNFIVEPLKIDGISYEIQNGLIFENDKPLGFFAPILKYQIYRLAYSSIQSRIDPLFGLEGIEPDKLDQAINLLKESTGSLSNLDKFSDQEVEFAKKNIHPMAFLSGLSQLESLRRELAYFPSEEILKEYNQALEITLGDYQKNIAALKQIAELIQKIEPKYATASINYIYGSTSIPYLVEKLTALGENAILKQNQFRNRIKCSSGFWKKCEPLKDIFAYRLSELKKDAQSNPDAPSPDFDIKNSQAYDIATTFLKNNLAIFDFRSEPILKIKTDCFGEQNNAYFLDRWFKNDKRVEIHKPQLVNDLLFVDLVKHKNKNSFYDPLVKKNQLYYWQTETSYYICPNLGYQATFFSEYYLIKTLRQTALFRGKNFPYSSLPEKEVRLAESLVLNQGDFAAFFLEATELLNQQGETALADKIGEEAVFFLEKLLNIYYQQSSGLTELIISGWHQNQNFTKFMDIPTNEKIFNQDPGYFFIRRSAPAIYFLTFNKSVLDTEPQFFQRINKDHFEKYVLFSELNSSSREETLNIMQNSFRLPNIRE